MAKIIGKGLLANTFSSSALDSRFVLFASGVSNSRETRASEFRREKDLLKQVIKDNYNSTIIYFSTCSIYQKNQVAYTEHKLEMEELLIGNAKYYHVYRLPQVVGVVNNTTLICFFVRSLLENSKLYIQQDAKRNLISVLDVYRIVEKISLSNASTNFRINLASYCSISVESILIYISQLMGSKPSYTLVPGGEDYDISLSMLMELHCNNDKIFDSSYWKFVLNNAVPKLVKLIEKNNEKNLN